MFIQFALKKGCALLGVVHIYNLNTGRMRQDNETLPKEKNKVIPRFGHTSQHFLAPPVSQRSLDSQWEGPRQVPKDTHKEHACGKTSLERFWNISPKQQVWEDGRWRREGRWERCPCRTDSLVTSQGQRILHVLRQVSYTLGPGQNYSAGPPL